MTRLPADRKAKIKAFNSFMPERQSGYLACTRCGQSFHISRQEGHTLGEIADTVLCVFCHRLVYGTGKASE